MALVALWILFSAWLCAVGWILSALNALNGPGYLVALAVTMAGAWIFNKSWWPAGGRRWPNWRKLGRRFRRPAPLMILVIALLGLAGGLESAPENGDSNAYRVPRVLQWLSQAGWHWIRTEDARENVAGCAYAWFFAPLLLLTHNARWIFLPNLITYFLLPGQLFNFFRRLKIESRVAWWWTWLLAAGWCYTLQACSTNDDSLASVYALAALAYALRAREENSFGGLWLSLLAAALMTAVKPTNLPLLLPCFIAAYPSWRLLLTRPLASAGLIVFGVLASFLPLAILCWRHTGSWKGYQLESGPAHWWHYGPTQELASPFWGFLGNTFCLTAQNLLPPFFPWASAWNQAMQFFLQTSFGAHFASFEKFGRLSRSVSPTSAGLGLHIVFMVLVTVIFLIIVRRSRATICPVARPAIYRWLQWTPWLALVPFMAKVGSYQNARFLSEPVELTILMPCLNEAETLARCIEKARLGIQRAGVRGEIIIADNGSTDGSQAIAEKLGARVVPVKEKGYGSALRGGIAAAPANGFSWATPTTATIFPRRTGSSKNFRKALNSSWAAGCPLAAAPSCPARCRGKTAGSAIPVLSFIGRLFFKCPAHDFHCGLRGFTRAAFEKMDLQTTGMEFASEMVIKATLKKLKIAEVPVTLHPDGRSRPPHLKPWRDGWRHLRFMLLFSPRWLFLAPGIFLSRSARHFAAALSLKTSKLAASRLNVGTLIRGVHDRHRRLPTRRVRVFHQGVCHRRGAAARRPEIHPRLQIFHAGKRHPARPRRAAGGNCFARAAVWIWQQAHYGVCSRRKNLRRLIPAVTLVVLGIQAIFSSFFMSALGLKTTERTEAVFTPHFRLVLHQRFQLGLNNLFVFEKI
jgi:hypothetical protein